MKNANFIRLMFLILAVVFSALLFSAPQKTQAASESCTEEREEKCDDKKIQTDMILWESIGRHLLSSR